MLGELSLSVTLIDELAELIVKQASADEKDPMFLMLEEAIKTTSESLRVIMGPEDLKSLVDARVKVLMLEREKEQEAKRCKEVIARAAEAVVRAKEEELQERERLKEGALSSVAKTPWAVVSQKAVGHGGFHTGALGYEKPAVRWIYDCGAWRKKGKEALRREIGKLAKRMKGEKINLLFVSHFDSDHVSGLMQLLRGPDAIDIDTVFVPYLALEDSLSVQANAVARNSWQPELADAVGDTEKWFLDRGARRVITVHPGSLPEDGWPPPEPREPAGAERPADFEPQLIGPGNEVLPWESRHVQAGTTVAIASWMRGWTDWCFVPYVHDISPDVRDRLKRAAEKFLGLPATDSEDGRHAFNAALKAMLADPNKRPEFKSVYMKSGLKDANAISMSLYAGPRKILAPGQRRCVYTAGSWDDAMPAGWLLTGDAKLGDKARCNSWRLAYRNFQTGMLMLPHHGAAKNFHPDVISISNTARLFVTVDNADDRRPHQGVREKLDRPYVKVTELSSDEICQLSGPPGKATVVLPKLDRYGWI